MENIVMVTDEKSDTLFSCHTDTVHWHGGRQQVVYDENLGVIYTDGESSDCLGADDGTGVWLMLEMIACGVPGTYIFHRGEECGGVGSRWLRENEQDFLKRFKRAIAFDRKDVWNVITHQGGQRCCSGEFAEKLYDALNKTNDALIYDEDDTGVFTDTKNYVYLIPECTNLSVGYYDQHTSNERQDVRHAMRLLSACLEVDWEALPVHRKIPEEPKYYSGLYRGYGALDDGDQDAYEGWGYYGNSGRPAIDTPAAPAPATREAIEDDAERLHILCEEISLMGADDLANLDHATLQMFCTEYPDGAAEHLGLLAADNVAMQEVIEDLKDKVAELQQQLSSFNSHEKGEVDASPTSAVERDEVAARAEQGR